MEALLQADLLAEVLAGDQAIRLRASGAKFELGPVGRCGHTWPGRPECLRLKVKSQKNGPCVICRSARGSLWWLLFADEEGMGLASGERIGSLCSRAHMWNGLPFSLRRGDHCVECEQRPERRDQKKEYSKKMRTSGKEQEWTRNRTNRVNACPEARQRKLDQTKERNRRVRARLKAQGLTVRGLPPALPPPPPTPEQIEERRYLAWLKKPLVSPTVLCLVRSEQRQYWKEHPEDKKIIVREAKAHKTRLRYLTNEAYRESQKEKRMRRKASEKKVWLQKVSAADIRSRRAQFDGCCAYCGISCKTVMDHFQPIARGGTHTLGNLLPACHACNSDKSAKDPEVWCREQPWFTEKRWRKLLAMINKKPSNVGQLTLI